MRPTVLIVDENANARIIAETLLRVHGIHVQCAADGTEAREILRGNDGTIAVLVVDMDEGVSGMNGWELLRCLSGRFGGLPLPTPPQIVAVSDRTEAAIERFARRLGASAFLHKPFAPREFIETVRQLLAHHVMHAHLEDAEVFADNKPRRAATRG